MTLKCIKNFKITSPTLRSNASGIDIVSGITRVGVTRPQRQLMGVTLFFLNLTIFLVIASQIDDLFSCRLLYYHLPTSFIQCSFYKFSHKNNFRSGVTPWRVLPGAPPSDATGYL